MRPILLLALLLAASLAGAGCLSAGTDTPPVENAVPAPFVDPILDAASGHDHADPAQHNLTWHMEQLGYHSLGEDGNKTRGTYGEIDVVGDVAFVAVLGDGGETPGVVTLDVKDRAHPLVLSFTPVPFTRLADVKGDPSGDYFYVGAQAWTLSPTIGSRVRQPTPDLAQDATKRMQWQFQDGVQVYDVKDKSQPGKIVAGAVSEEGCHMVMPKVLKGATYLFCVGSTVNIFKWDPSGRSVTLAGEYQPQSPAGASTILANDRSDPQRFVNEARLGLRPHDMTVQEDPASGAVLAIVSYWDWGLRVVDVSDPARPAEVGAWNGQGATHYEGNVHTGMLATINGTRVIVCIPELLSNNVPGVFILDATDLGKLTLLGEWYAPGDHGADGLRTSTHNFQIVQGRLYMAYYHAGVWVLDISSNETLRSPGILGYYLPHEDVQTYEPREQVSIPDVWDVVLKDGYLYATDINTGLYVLHYTPDPLGDPALTSFA